MNHEERAAIRRAALVDVGAAIEALERRYVLVMDELIGTGPPRAKPTRSAEKAEFVGMLGRVTNYIDDLYENERGDP